MPGRGEERLRKERAGGSSWPSGPLGVLGAPGVLDEVGWEAEGPDVVGFPGAGPMADEGGGRHLLGRLPVDAGALVVAVEAESDRGEAEGVGEGFCEVPRAGEAPLVVVAGFAGLPDLGQGGGEMADGDRVLAA